MEKPFSLYKTRKLVGKYQLEIISASRLTEILNEKAEEYAKSKIDDLHGVSNNIQPSEINTLLKEKYSHKALKDEFGVNGQYDLSSKDILDIIIDLSNCC